eukprot:c11160_g1_i1 orf=222-2270(+)
MAGASTAAALYVGDLDAEVTESQLYELFTQAGPVASVRVCRDLVSRRSLGYAYVNFVASADETAAVRAIESLNSTPVNGKAIRIMWSHRDASRRGSGSANLFVKNLHESIDNKELHEIFLPMGSILSCKVSTQDGKSRGYGFVQYETDEAANLAIERINGATIKGKKLYVVKFIRKSERTLPGAEVMFTNLYVKNIDPDITEEVLHSNFAEYGRITNVIIMKDEEHKPKGFGFVNFERPDDARRAVEAMNGALLGSKAIFVGRAQKKAEREQILRQQFEEKQLERSQQYQGSNLYVKNLDDRIDDEYLQRHFSCYGNIVSAKVMRNEKGISKGFGFVCFSSPEEATKAVSEHGSMVFGKPIYVAPAQRREVRRAQLELQYAQRLAGIPGSPGTILAAPYPHMYYSGPPGAIPPLSQRQGAMYPLGIRSGWRPEGVPPPGRPGFQPMPLFPMGPAGLQPQRHIRSLANGQFHPRAGPLPVVIPPQQQQIYNSRSQQHRQRQPSNGRPRESPMNGTRAPAVLGTLASPPAATRAQPTSPADWSSLLANAPAQQQKQMLGERLFPLVQRVQPKDAGKITGMLLEMDNSELLLLLESPESLVSKVEEAVHVLQQHISAGHDAQDPPQPPVAGQQEVQQHVRAGHDSQDLPQPPVAGQQEVQQHVRAGHDSQDLPQPPVAGQQEAAD